MDTLQQIMQRAQALRKETALDSISPERAGGIMYDTLSYINLMQLQDANPILLSKIYSSVEAMQADTAPVSDITGKALRPGQVVVIVTSSTSSPDYGVVYRYNGIVSGASSWTAVGKIGSSPYLEGYLYAGIATPATDPQTVNITQRVFYRAVEPGTYTNFGGIVVNSGEVVNLKFDGSSWSKEVTGEASAASVTELDQQVNQLDQQVDELGRIVGSGPTTVRGKYINSNGVEVSDANSAAIGFLPYFTGNDVIWTYGVKNANYRLCFYDANKQFISGSDFIPASDSSARQRSITAADIQRFASNAAYLKASINNSAEDACVQIGETVYVPDYSGTGLVKTTTELSQSVEELSGQVAENESEIQNVKDKIDNLNSSDIENLLLLAFFNFPPRGRYQQTFGQRRIAQLVLLQWTPKGAIPLRNGASVTTPQVGLIYSETMEIDKFVGYDVSIHTFMTAVNNPHSVLYTENISASRSRSAYGITYHGDGNSGAYYGSVCNTLAAMGSSPVIHPTTAEKWLGRCPYYFRNDDQSVRGCHIGDIIGKNTGSAGHELVITDIDIDNDGIITRVQISEENGIKAVMRGWFNETEFANFLATNGYEVGKLSLMLTNNKYEPSPYVPLDGEELPEVVYNEDICTMYGDKPCLKESDILVIHYVKGNYTSMEIYKDDVLIDTKALPASASDYAIDLTGNSYGYGMFKARLVGSGIQSDYTYWEIVDVQAALSDDNILSVFSENGTPLYWEWCRQDGLPWQQTLIKDSYITVGEKPTNYPLLKVHIEGKYGRISKIVEEGPAPGPAEIVGDVLGTLTYANNMPAGTEVIIAAVFRGHAGLYRGDNRYVTSPFVAVPANRQFNIKFGESRTGLALQEYTSAIISDFVPGDTAWDNAHASERSITVSAGARYVRITVLNSPGNGYGIYDSNNNPLWTW